MLGLKLQSSVGPLGIDFGSRYLKVLQLRHHSSGLDIVGGFRLKYPQGGITGDSQGHWSELVRSSLSTSGCNGRKCIVSLAREDVAIQSVRMPKLSEEELRQVVRWEAAERFHFDRNNIEIDFVRLGEVQQGGEIRDEILIIAAERSVIQEKLEPLSAAGLRPIAVDLGIMSLVRFYSMSCRREADRSHARALLEVGNSGSLFMVLRGDQVAMCKPIPIGGADLDKAVASHLGIELQVASELRCKRILDRVNSGSQDATEDDKERAIFEAVRSQLNRIVKEVGLCLRYYGVTFRGKPPVQLILAGGDSLEPKFDEILSRSCSLEVEFHDQVSQVTPLFDKIDDWTGAGNGSPITWAVAAGLSIREISTKQSSSDTNVVATSEAAA